MNRKRIEKISKALADETRLMLFEAIAGRDEMNCGDLVKMRGVTPATISHHLKILADAELIECRRNGQFVRSTVVPKTLSEYALALCRIARRRGKRRPGTKRGVR
jgi:ArsR family transcriptional regulator, arsenate/arsenite/antimonite-responsive transcriptional repressor